MSTVSFVSSTTTTITFQVTGLQYPAADYDYFQWELTSANGTVTVYGPINAGTTDYTFTVGVDANTEYRCYCTASYLGAMYAAGNGNGWTKAPPSPPTNVSVTVSGKKATVSFTKGANAYATNFDYYWVTGEPDATTTGSSYIITAPDYNTYYEFDMRSVDADSVYYSNYTSVFSFTTGAPPPAVAPTGITTSVSGRSVTISYTKGANSDYTEISYDAGYTPDDYPEAETSTTMSLSLSGLTWDTVYYYKLRGTNVGGSSAWSAVKSFTIGAAPLPGTPSAPTFGTRYEGSINVSWGTGTNAEGYELEYTDWTGVYYYDSASTSKRIYYVDSQGTTGTPVLFNYGTQYDIRVRSYNTGAGGVTQYSGWSGSNTGTTNPKEPGLTLYATGQTYFDVTVTGMDSNAGAFDKVEVYRRTTSTGAILETQIATVNNTILRFNASLSPNTKYYVEAKAFLTTVSATVIYNITKREITVTTSNLPQVWKWTTAQDAAGHKQAGSFSMLASEWNAFTTRVNEFRTAKGLAAYGFTTAVSGNPFTAVIFNQAISAITAIPGRTVSPPATVTTNDPVTLVRMNGVMDSVNSTT